MTDLMVVADGLTCVAATEKRTQERMEPPSVIREDVLCALCGIDDSIQLHRVRGRSLRGVYLDDVFLPVAEQERIVSCRRCGLIYVNPRLAPVPGLRAYSAEEESAYFHATEADREINATLLLQQIEMLLGDTGHLLDVGCGDGLLLKEAQRRGWKPWGLDVSEGLVTRVRARYALTNIFHGTLRAAAYLPAFFDAVCLINLIEHLRDPADTLVEVARIVRPGGIVAVHTPDVGSLQARLRGSAWHHYEPLEHFYYFNRDTLSLLLEKSGLHVIGSFVLPGASRAKRWLMLASHRLRMPLHNSLGLLAQRPA